MTTDFDRFIESGEALHKARQWLTDDHLLDAYLATRQADNDCREWINDQIRERLGAVG